MVYPVEKLLDNNRLMPNCLRKPLVKSGGRMAAATLSVTGGGRFEGQGALVE
jgi:hypothetical protein